MSHKNTVRVVTRAADGTLRIRDYPTTEPLLETHTQIGIDDCSTDLALRGMPVFRGLVGPMPEGKHIVRYESPDVFETLTDRGIALLPQWGASRYRIDLVAQHPREPGRLVLAIECDGATYHSAHTARDRDRLRQQHLERLGWRFHRIWSTDWFGRRDDEVARALAGL